jgi:quercetin dioxygenase-like cupin family protein
MEIERFGRRPPVKKEENFTGVVWRNTLMETSGRPVEVVSVTFAPGARTNWHSHPHGQTLIVTAGYGLAQGWAGRR